MANITVSVTDANNITVQLTPVAAQTITIDRGVAGNGISSIVPVTISTLQYLRIYYTNGTQQDVGPLTSTAYAGTSPIDITGNTISLTTVPINLGGTNATTAASAIQNLLPSYTGNGSKRLGLNSGATALEWVADGGGTVTSVDFSGGTTGLTTSGGPITGSGTITLAGTLATANGGTGQSSYAVGDLLYASSTTALSKLADVATGNALISGGVSTAPSWGKIGLTTHVSGTLPTANGGTGLTSFTANGVLYASNSSTLATGSALTFDGSALTVSASVAGASLTSSGAYSYLAFSNSGGATKAGLILTNSSGILQSRAETLAWTNYDASSEYMRIASATGGVGAVGIGYSTLTSVGNNGLAVLGNVGIGTSSPGYKLDIQGSAGVGAQIYETSTGTNKRLRLTQETAYVKYEATYSSGGNAHSWWNGGTRQMDLDVSGNLGIGTSSPAYKLDVTGPGTVGGSTLRLNDSVSGANSKHLLLQRSSSTATIGIAGALANDPLWLSRSGGYDVLIDSSGNLGVANTSPSSYNGVADNLVIGTSGSNGLTIVSGISNDGSIHFADGTSGADAYRGQIYYSHNGNYMVFSTDGSERARIDSSGNLLVGATTNTGGGRIEALSNATSAYTARSASSGTSTTVKAVRSVDGGASYFANAQYDALSHAWVLSNATTAMTLDASGNLLITGGGYTKWVSGSGGSTPTNGDAIVFGYSSLGAVLQGKGSSYDVCIRNNSGTIAGYVATGATTFTTSSDERLKENLSPITGALSKIAGLRKVTGNYKADPSRNVAFFIAQDLDINFPQAVEKADPEAWGVNYNWTIPLIAAGVDELHGLIKEQQAIITQLTARITALEGASS